MITDIRIDNNKYNLYEIKNFDNIKKENNNLNSYKEIQRFFNNLYEDCKNTNTLEIIKLFIDVQNFNFTTIVTIIVENENNTINNNVITGISLSDLLCTLIQSFMPITKYNKNDNCKIINHRLTRTDYNNINYFCCDNIEGFRIILTDE